MLWFWREDDLHSYGTPGVELTFLAASEDEYESASELPDRKLIKPKRKVSTRGCRKHFLANLPTGACECKLEDREAEQPSTPCPLRTKGLKVGGLKDVIINFLAQLQRYCQETDWPWRSHRGCLYDFR
jgi:hypothetical protein